jgi:hypothetical protein
MVTAVKQGTSEPVRPPKTNTEKPQGISSETSVHPSGTPWGLWIGLMVLVLALGAFGIYYLAFQDTWERDHEQALKALADKASTSFYTGKLEECLSTYDELFNLVGTRPLRNKYVIHIVENAKGAFSEARSKYEMQLMGKLNPQVTEAQNLTLRQKWQEAAERYNAILTTARVRKAQGQDLQRFIQDLQNAKANAERQIQEAKDAQRLAEQKAQQEAQQQRQEQVKREQERQKRAREVNQNPQPSFEAFAKTFVSNLRPWKGGTGEMLYWDKTYQINLFHTQSVSSPYLGTIEFYWLTSGQIAVPMRITIALQKNKWVLTSIDQNLSDHWTAYDPDWHGPADSIFLAFGLTPNP